MVTHDEIRAICAQLPGAIESGPPVGFGVASKGKVRGFLWTWLERVHPKKARVPNERFIALMVPSLSAKDVILNSNTDVFFTEDHYNGYRAVLVRLDNATIDDIEDLIIDAWRCIAPKQ